MFCKYVPENWLCYSPACASALPLGSSIVCNVLRRVSGVDRSAILVVWEERFGNIYGRTRKAFFDCDTGEYLGEG
jgi:hypothetical protein